VRWRLGTTTRKSVLLVHIASAGELSEAEFRALR
jgi:hypothetical protein